MATFENVCNRHFGGYTHGKGWKQQVISLHGQAHVQIGPFELIFGGVPVLG